MSNTILIRPKNSPKTFSLIVKSASRCSKVIYREEHDRSCGRIQTLTFIETESSVELPYRFICEEMFQPFGGFGGNLNIEMSVGGKITKIRETHASGGTHASTSKANTAGSAPCDLWKFMQDVYDTELEDVEYVDACDLVWERKNTHVRSCFIKTGAKKEELFEYSMDIDKVRDNSTVVARRFATYYGATHFPVLMEVLKDYGLLAFVDNCVGINNMRCIYRLCEEQAGEKIPV